MKIILFLVIILLNSHLALNILEQQFICLYDSIPGFPVNCSDAANACNYLEFTCDSNLSLTVFDVMICGGTNVIPSQINNLTNLVGFQIMMTPGCSTPPQGTIPSLTKANFRNIGLADLDISGTIPNELMLNTGLLTLDLSNTGLTGTIPQLNQLTSLTQLILENNDFSGDFPDITNLVNLQYLKISNNNFTGSLPNLSLIHI